MKLSLIQMNCGRDRDSNVAQACDFIDKAAKENPDLLVLPEFFNNMYFAQYRDYKYVQWAEKDDGFSIKCIKEKAKQHSVYIIATIYEQQQPGIYFDTAMVIDQKGQMVGKYRKTHPAGFRALELIYYRYGSQYPVFEICGWKVGIVICYDLNFPESARCVTLNGAELVIVPFASPVGYLSSVSSSQPDNTGPGSIDKAGWLHKWDLKTSMRALENIVFLAPCNHTGQEGDAVFCGSSRIVSPKGEIIVDAGEEEKVITAELERQSLINARQTTPFLRDRRPHIYKAIVSETEDLLSL